MGHPRIPLAVAALCAAFTLVAAGSAPASTHGHHHRGHAKTRRGASPATNPITIKVLSGRADLVSGGDALVAIGGVQSAAGLSVTAAGADQTSNFGVGPDGQVEGLVTGLALGKTTVIART